MNDYEEIALYNKDGIVCYTKIDADDYDDVCVYRWYLSSYGYACNSRQGFLHRFILGSKKDNLAIDHINGDKIDNRKSNLRYVTDSENGQNKQKREGCTSNFIGVSFRNDISKWRCIISVNNIQHRFSFEKEEHAAYWYDQLALKYYGSQAKINGIEKPDNFIEPLVKNKRNLPKGVCLSKYNKYEVRFAHKYLGTFETVEEAKNVYIKTEIKAKENKIKQIIERNEDGIAIIKTSKEEEILVDDDKYYELKKHTWCVTGGYARAKINNQFIRMHRYLLKPEDTEIIDHINRNKTDNRISNLRLSNSSLNMHNKSKLNGISKYIGVTFENGNFRAQISKDKRQYKLGSFKTENEAAEAYNKKAIELYGKFANPNIIVAC